MNPISSQQANTMLDAFSIPVKICDGLFMADRHIAQVYYKKIVGRLVLLNKPHHPRH